MGFSVGFGGDEIPKTVELKARASGKSEATTGSSLAILLESEMRHREKLAQLKKTSNKKLMKDLSMQKGVTKKSLVKSRKRDEQYLRNIGREMSPSKESWDNYFKNKEIRND